MKRGREIKLFCASKGTGKSIMREIYDSRNTSKNAGSGNQRSC